MRGELRTVIYESPTRRFHISMRTYIITHPAEAAPSSRCCSPGRVGGWAWRVPNAGPWGPQGLENAGSRVSAEPSEVKPPRRVCPRPEGRAVGAAAAAPLGAGHRPVGEPTGASVTRVLTSGVGFALRERVHSVHCVCVHACVHALFARLLGGPVPGERRSP